MSKTLLLADDSVVIQKLVALSFANEDVELVTTDNGDDAITRANEIKPDLVLADVVMPGKSGYEVCEAIRQNPELSQVPVLLLTGTFEAFDADRAERVQSDGHITKPFEAQALVDRVNQLLARAPASPATPEPVSSVASAGIASPVPPVPGPADSTPSYDFFDENVESLAAPEEAPSSPADFPVSPGLSDAAIAAPGDSFSFGDDDDVMGDSLDFAPVAPIAPEAPEVSESASDDRTVAFLPDGGPVEDLLSAPEPARNLDASPFDVGSDLGAPPSAPEVQPETRLEAGVGTITAAAMEMQANQAAPVYDTAESVGSTTADDMSFGSQPPPLPPATDPADTVLADDLFADSKPQVEPALVAPPEPPPLTPEVPNPTIPVTSSPAAEFDFGGGGGGAPGTHDPLLANDELIGDPPPAPTSASDYDVSSSDLGDPLVDFAANMAAPAEPELPPVAAAQVAAAEAPMITDPVPASSTSLDEIETGPLDMDRFSRADDISMGSGDQPVFASSAGLGDEDIARKVDLTPMMRERVHETLEKVAWEAFADLSDTIVREVLKKVEKVAWEVIPQMAESLVREEIRRMKDEQD